MVYWLISATSRPRPKLSTVLPGLFGEEGSTGRDAVLQPCISQRHVPGLLSPSNLIFSRFVAALLWPGVRWNVRTACILLVAPPRISFFYLNAANRCGDNSRELRCAMRFCSRRRSFGSVTISMSSPVDLGRVVFLVAILSCYGMRRHHGEEL